MTKSTITREQQRQILIDTAQHIISRDNTSPYSENLREIGRIALAAIDSEPNRNPVLPYADSYRDMAKQGVELVPIWSVITDLERNIAPLYRHAQQSVVQKIMARLAYLLDEDQFHNIESMVLAAAQQPAPVVPQDVLDALQKVARIRLDLNDFDGDCRGIADCLDDAEEALIEVVNRRAAMLSAAPQEVNRE